MKTSRVLWLVTLGLACGLRPAGATVHVRVKGAQAKLRADASFRSEVICEVKRDSVLEALRFDGEWVAVVPPDDATFWVHSALLQGDTVNALKAPVRAGPGARYTVLSALKKGASVTRRGSFVDWIKIAPPPDCNLWVHAMLLERVNPGAQSPVAVSGAAAPPAAQTVPEPAVPRPISTVPSARAKPLSVAAPITAPVAPQPVTARPSATGPAPSTAEPTPAAEPEIPAALLKYGLIPLDGQGRNVSYDGVMKTAGYLFRRPAKYRLVAPGPGAGHTLCYVRGRAGSLSPGLGRRVRVQGREYWLKGMDVPVVVVDRYSWRQ